MHKFLNGKNIKQPNNRKYSYCGSCATVLNFCSVKQ